MNEDSTASGDVIPNYAGQRDVSSRQLSEQQTRALVGEALSSLRERFPADGMTVRLDELIERCQFGVPRVMIALENARLGQPANAQQVAAADRELVQLARRLGGAAPGDLPRLLDELTAALDRHDELILALAGD
jgi:hypothetical protein